VRRTQNIGKTLLGTAGALLMALAAALGLEAYGNSGLFYPIMPKAERDSLHELPVDQLEMSIHHFTIEYSGPGSSEKHIVGPSQNCRVVSRREQVGHLFELNVGMDRYSISCFPENPELVWEVAEVAANLRIVNNANGGYVTDESSGYYFILQDAAGSFSADKKPLHTKAFHTYVELDGKEFEPSMWIEKLVKYSGCFTGYNRSINITPEHFDMCDAGARILFQLRRKKVTNE
jgi:hypothetical protein